MELTEKLHTPLKPEDLHPDWLANDFSINFFFEYKFDLAPPPNIAQTNFIQNVLIFVAFTLDNDFPTF